MKFERLIINETGCHVFDTFVESYSIKIVNICPLLERFSIHIVQHTKTPYWQLSCNNNDTFGFYINKKEHDVASTYAEVSVNIDMCNSLCLTLDDMLAALTHEIGHIIMYFRTDKMEYQGQAEEIYCDIYACKIGLGKPLYSLVQKLIDSGKYPDAQINQMQNRLIWIKNNIS